MRIQHNIMAMNAYRNYSNNTSALSKNLERLSSGYKINRAGDDAAGLAISEKMRAQITGLEAAQKNVKDGISLVNTAEGAMQEIQDMLNRMVYLATQSANGTYDNEVDRLNLQKEVDSLKTEINRIAESANFNGIKLLDGSQEDTLVGEEGLKTVTAEMAKGIDIVNGDKGGGSYGEYSIDITQAFGDSDTIKFDFACSDNTKLGGLGAGITLAHNAAGGANTFKGVTADEQARSIAEALSGNTDIAANFTVTAEGSTVKLVNKNEGNKEVSVSNVTPTNLDATIATGTDALPTAKTGKSVTKGDVTFSKLFDGTATTGGMELNAGQTLHFEFETNSGKKMTVDLEITADMLNGAGTAATTTTIANALKNKAFNDDPDTVADESKIKLSDVFTITDNGTNPGDLKFDLAGKDKAFDIKSISVTNTGTGTKIAGGTIANADTAAVANEYTLAMDGASDTNNLAYGDKLTIEGALSDGRTFSIEMTAGEDFEIAATSADTIKNLKQELQIKGIDVKLSDGKTVKSTDIFGTDKEINITDGGVFTSVAKGNVGKTAGGITEITLDNAPTAAIDQNLAAGSPQTAASSTLTFSDGLNYGSTVTVDGRTYEIVKNAEDISSGRNIAVVAADANDSAAVAKAFADAYNDTNGAGADYTAVASGDKVTIKSNDVGSTQTAVQIQTAGDTETRLEFTLDPAKVQSGSTVTINGNKYQFVKKGEADTVGANAKAVEVDFNGATAKSLADALANAADGKANAKITVGADGLVTVKGTPDKDGNVSVPTVTFANGKGTGLQLQIGDTSDSYNQLKVGIGAMKTGNLGIDGINIGTQSGAQAAIDVIKNAINYVSSIRGDLGAISNRLDHTANNLSVMRENIQDAESAIRDTDIAEEMMSYTKNNILVQSAQAMLAQANQVPQGVLQLLQ